MWRSCLSASCTSPLGWTWKGRTLSLRPSTMWWSPLIPRATVYGSALARTAFGWVRHTKQRDKTFGTNLFLSFVGRLCCEGEHLFFDLSQTDEVHAKDNTRPGANTPGAVQFMFMKQEVDTCHPNNNPVLLDLVCCRNVVRSHQGAEGRVHRSSH